MLTKTSPPRPSHYHVPRYYYLTERDAGEYDVPPAFRGLRDPDIPGCEGFPYLYLSPAPAPAPIPIPNPNPFSPTLDPNAEQIFDVLDNWDDFEKQPELKDLEAEIKGAERGGGEIDDGRTMGVHAASARPDG